MAKYHYLSEKEFSSIKSLLKAEVKQAIVCRATGRSSGLISSINKYDTLEEYKKAQIERTAKWMARKKGTLLVTKTSTKPVLNSDSLGTLPAQQMIKLLTSINNELILIKDQLSINNGANRVSIASNKSFWKKN